MKKQRTFSKYFKVLPLIILLAIGCSKAATPTENTSTPTPASVARYTGNCSLDPETLALELFWEKEGYSVSQPVSVFTLEKPLQMDTAVYVSIRNSISVLKQPIIPITSPLQ